MQFTAEDLRKLATEEDRIVREHIAYLEGVLTSRARNGQREYTTFFDHSVVLARVGEYLRERGFSTEFVADGTGLKITW